MEASRCRVYSQPAEVRTKLHLLGLEEEDVAWAVRHGEDHASWCTGNDPRVLTNFMRWGKTFRGLADRLASRQWTHEERQSFPLMVNPERTIAITVSSGDALTGTAESRMPRSRNPKGPLTRRVVSENQYQIPGLADLVTHLRPSSTEPRTWFLLYHLDRETDEIRVELSLAAGMGESGCISEWFERIVLPPLPRTGSAGTDEDEDQVDIEIHRRDG